MSDACRHTGEPTWLGPTPEDILKASGRRHLVVRFAHRRSTLELLVTIEEATASLIWPDVSFKGRSSDGRRVEQGIACASAEHRRLIHIEFIHLPLLVVVADAS